MEGGWDVPRELRALSPPIGCVTSLVVCPVSETYTYICMLNWIYLSFICAK